MRTLILPTQGGPVQYPRRDSRSSRASTKARAAPMWHPCLPGRRLQKQDPSCTLFRILRLDRTPGLQAWSVPPFTPQQFCSSHSSRHNLSPSVLEEEQQGPDFWWTVPQGMTRPRRVHYQQYRTEGFSPMPGRCGLSKHSTQFRRRNVSDGDGSYSGRCLAGGPRGR